jgi:hypothetical protein
MAPDPKDQQWYSIAEQASLETDSAKLLTLVDQLCAALDERTKSYAMGQALDTEASSGND